MDIENLKIKNLDINRSAFLKKKVYKLRVGIVIFGIVVGTFIGINDCQRYRNKAFADMSIEEIEMTRAIVECNFGNIDKLDQNGDRIVFVRNGQFIAAVVKIDSDGNGNFEAALLPGDYKVISEKVDMIEFTVNNIEQSFELNVDYNNGMCINEIDTLVKTRN